MKESLRPKKYRCDAEGCKKAYSRPCLLEQHKRTHSNSRPFVCEECGKGFFRETHLKVHVWIHAPDKPLKCSVCDKGFITNQQLGRHLKTHTLKHGCPYECEAKFYTEKDLTDHVLSDHILSDVIDIETHQVLNGENGRNVPVPAGPFVTNTPSTSDTVSLKTCDAPSLVESSGFNSDESPSADRISPSDPYYWENWNDKRCKEPSCKDCGPCDDFYELISHYDEYHKYVPETLCVYHYQMKEDGNFDSL